jgi:CheY-like chemotaxis protein
MMFHKISLRELTQETPAAISSTPVILGNAGVNPFLFPLTSCANLRTESHASRPIQPDIPRSSLPFQTAQPLFPSTHPSQKRILIIDDSPTIRNIMETCLRREGFQVQSFPDGIEAMRWLIGPQARVPDLVWLDIGLPRLDGYEVARHLRAKPSFHHTIIVMLIGRVGVGDRLKSLLVGANRCLTKPLTTQEVVSITRSLLGLAQTAQEVLPNRLGWTHQAEMHLAPTLSGKKRR